MTTKNITQLTLSLVLAGLFSLALLLIGAIQPVSVVYAAGESCFATIDGTTVYSSTDASTVQEAIDAATADDLIKVAGECVGTQTISGNT